MSEKRVVLVTGKNGQLGNELQLIASQYPAYRFVFTDVGELDISDEEKVNQAFAELRPAICINAAAYTAVDKAEVDRELSMKVNGDAVGVIARACKATGSTFIHVSTDYVFDGRGSIPYKEDDPVKPVNYYGETKLKGEQLAVKEYPSSIIIRTSWVYSYFGSNFVKTMMRVMKERESVGVVNDQYGSPTYAADLAEAIMIVATSEKSIPGIYHYSNQGEISWYDFAAAIKDYSNLNCMVDPIPTSSYPTPAKRPHYSVLDKTKISSTFGVTLKPWEQSLAICIRALTG